MNKDKAISYEFKSVRGTLISISDASKITGLGKDWFYQRMNEGTLPFPWFPCGGKRLMDAADLDDWLSLIKIPAAKRPGDKKGSPMKA